MSIHSVYSQLVSEHESLSGPLIVACLLLQILKHVYMGKAVMGYDHVHDQHLSDSVIDMMYMFGKADTDTNTF